MLLLVKDPRLAALKESPQPLNTRSVVCPLSSPTSPSDQLSQWPV